MPDTIASQHAEFAEQVKELSILTTYNEDEMMLRGLQAGARDYLFKDTDRATLLDTIYTTAKGDTLLKPEILHRVLAMPPSPKRSKYPEGEDNPLTDREREVLRSNFVTVLSAASGAIYRRHVQSPRVPPGRA